MDKRSCGFRIFAIAKLVAVVADYLSKVKRRRVKNA